MTYQLFCRDITGEELSSAFEDARGDVAQIAAFAVRTRSPQLVGFPMVIGDFVEVAVSALILPIVLQNGQESVFIHLTSEEQIDQLSSLDPASALPSPLTWNGVGGNAAYFIR